MLTNHFVVQKITLDSKVILYQARSEHLSWQFETRRKPGLNENEDVFPFIFDEDTPLRMSNAGAETSALVRNERYVVFNDKYGVPGGIAVGILFPVGFAPNIFKFAERPHIPLGIPNNVSVSPPGYFDIYYNHHTKQSAIVFMIGSPTYFEFRCAAKHIKGEFPRERYSSHGEDTLKLTLNVEEFGKVSISSNDLLRFSDFFKPESNLDEIRDQLNRLIALLQDDRTPENRNEITQLKKGIRGLIAVTEYSSAIVQLLDSYISGGVVQQVIAKILSYLIM